MDYLEAKEVLKAMSFEQCIKMWNESARDNNMRTYEVHEMDDETWWKWLMDNTIPTMFVKDRLSSSEECGNTFKQTDWHFFYDLESNMFVSFSSKQEFLKVIEEDFFLNEIMNRQ